MTDTQPFKFRLTRHDGTVIEGGAESKELAIDHIRHCLAVDDTIAMGVYLGKNGNAEPKQIFL